MLKIYWLFVTCWLQVSCANVEIHEKKSGLIQRKQYSKPMVTFNQHYSLSFLIKKNYTCIRSWIPRGFYSKHTSPFDKYIVPMKTLLYKYNYISSWYFYVSRLPPLNIVQNWNIPSLITIQRQMSKYVQWLLIFENDK